MGSRASALEPLVITILFPARSPGPRSLSTSQTIAALSAILALPSSRRGSISKTPMPRRASRFRSTAGWRYMASCMAGTTATLLPLPKAVVAKVVTGVSSMPQAILPMVLAVAGATRSMSASPPTPQNWTCSTLARDLPDHRVGAGVLQGVRMEDLLCCGAHDAVHLGSPPDQVANEVHNAHGCDAAGNRHYYRLSPEGMAHRSCDVGGHSCRYLQLLKDGSFPWAEEPGAASQPDGRGSTNLI